MSEENRRKNKSYNRVKIEKGGVALTIFLVNRQSLSHGIENSQPLSISAQEQIMIFGQHKTEALFPCL